MISLAIEPPLARAAGQPSARWNRIVPLLGLAYAMIFQPLMSFDLQAGQNELDLAVNSRTADSNPINQIFWLSLFLLGLVLSRRRLKSIGQMSGQPAALLIGIYMAVALASIIWSPVPAIALRRWILQAVVISVGLFGSYLAQDRHGLARGAAWLMWVVAFVNLPVVLVEGSGRLGGSLGIYSDKNILGLSMVLAIAFMLYGIISVPKTVSRVLLMAGIVAGLINLVLSDSKTSIALVPVCLVLAAALLLWSRLMRMPLGSMLLLALLTLSCLLLSYFAFGGSRDAILSTLFGDPTFSGRTEIWSFVSDAVWRRPLQGIGFASFWGTGQNSLVVETAPGFIVGLLQAHSGYLDVLVELGAIGFVLLIAIIISAFRLLDKPGWSRTASIRWLLLSIMLFAVAHNFMESSWFRGFATVWYAYLMAVGMALPSRLPAGLNPAKP